MKRVFRATTVILLAICLLFLDASYAYASDLSTIKQEQELLNKKQEETRKKKQEAQQKASSLQSEADNLSSEVNKLNNKLSTISNSISITEKEIEDTNQDIEIITKELNEANNQCVEQYESMKKRIQYMYENGTDSMLVTLLESGSIAQLMRRLEYISALMSYDRGLMENYSNLRTQIEDKSAELSDKYDNLSEYQSNLEKNKAAVNELVSSTTNTLNAKQGEVNEANKEVANYEAQLAQMESYEKELEDKYAKVLANMAANGTGILANEYTGGALVGYTEADVMMMAAIIQCESGGEPYEGKIAVGSVVMNRLMSSKFPNTVSGVIYQSGQFSPVASGKFALVLANGPNATCRQAAVSVLSGTRNTDALYFRTVSSATNSGLIYSTAGTVIGNHYFFNFI